MSFVYLDTSVALAHLLAEDNSPPSRLWRESLISSRLFEYEVWTRVHAYRVGANELDSARRLIGRVALVELISPILERAKEPFPQPVRTLDALHLSSLMFLKDNDQEVALATYDSRMKEAAQSLHIPLYRL